MCNKVTKVFKKIKQKYSQVEHDFAQEHVFESCDGSGAVDRVVALKGLKEVGVGGLPVLLLGSMDDPCSNDTLQLTLQV